MRDVCDLLPRQWSAPECSGGGDRPTANDEDGWMVPTRDSSCRAVTRVQVFCSVLEFGPVPTSPTSKFCCSHEYLHRPAR